ncbi:MDR family MFS transporter [Paenactinomyces guangxiensis]|uniref:MFS transporter n=1 Tax=Paenactinomyces guangxiensis TaxID=1490290 RepID=A0A7W1WQ09_9BACL|nr:MFS transporter [Paenactinomyces guangxiensis]MBA4493958.1 MFS transporter [Paenactinomyces guangxiensis]MBH8591425.1 MFS transporter [Paenactinomyces guangxiensis]
MKQLIQDLKRMDRNIWIRFIGETLNGIAFMMLMPFFALYLKEKVDSLVQVGVVMAVAPTVAVAGSVMGGRLADTCGRKPIMILSMLGNGIVMLGFLFFDSFPAYMILSAGMGFFNSLFHPAASAMVTDVTESENRTEAFGLLRMGHNIGAAIGPLIGATIVVLSKAVIFLSAAATLIIYSLIVLFFIRETLPAQKQPDSQKDDFSSSLKILLRDKVLALFVVTGIVISMGFSQTEGMLPLHFDNEMSHIFGKNNPFPYLMALNGALVVLFQFPISRWANAKPIGKMMLYGALLFGIGLLAIGWLPTLFGHWNTNYIIVLSSLLLAYTVYTLGEMVMSPVQMTFVANIAPENLRGTYMGASGLQWIIGGAAGPVLGGLLLEHSFGNLLFTLLGFGCIAAGMIYLSLDRRVKGKNATPKIKRAG